MPTSSVWPEIGWPSALTSTSSAAEWDEVSFHRAGLKDLWERLGLVLLSSRAEGLGLQRGAPRSTMCLGWGGRRMLVPEEDETWWINVAAVHSRKASIHRVLVLSSGTCLFCCRMLYLQALFFFVLIEV